MGLDNRVAKLIMLGRGNEGRGDDAVLAGVTRDDELRYSALNYAVLQERLEAAYGSGRQVSITTITDSGDVIAAVNGEQKTHPLSWFGYEEIGGIYFYNPKPRTSPMPNSGKRRYTGNRHTRPSSTPWRRNGRNHTA
ncbi:hypothetical protein HYV82_06815 [Candidatus Woesearchaeota archaeon]|nr:hypothetical protein [Candidatus Woesearchaeota archaeon]